MTDITMQHPQQEEAPARDPTKAAQRTRLLLGVTAVLAAIGLMWWLWSTFFAADTESTENAYTNVELAQVTPLVGGAVTQVDVTNTQPVRAGQVLLRIDGIDMQLAVEQAEAALGRARRQVEQVLANDANLAGQVDVRAADVDSARADLVRAEADLAKAELDERRRAALAGPARFPHRSSATRRRSPCRSALGFRRRARVSLQRKPVGGPPSGPGMPTRSCSRMSMSKPIPMSSRRRPGWHRRGSTLHVRLCAPPSMAWSISAE